MRKAGTGGDWFQPLKVTKQKFSLKTNQFPKKLYLCSPFRTTNLV